MTEIQKEYSYEVTNKSGKKVNKRVVRKYVNKKETNKTLQNKDNKLQLEKNINEHFDDIMKLNERKRITYIKNNLLPYEITASYNTIKSIWNKILALQGRSEGVAESRSEGLAESRSEGVVEHEHTASEVIESGSQTKFDINHFVDNVSE